jgi:hypothetical protein
VAWAQQRPKVARLGVLLFSSPEADPQMKAVHVRLREPGYVEGQNLIVIYRYAEGKYERLPELAAELVGEKPDLVLALGGDVAPYAAKASSTTPIVFVSSADQSSLASPRALLGPRATRPASRSCWTIQPRSGWSSSRKLYRECSALRSYGIPNILTMNYQKPSVPPQLSTCNCSLWRCGGPASLKVRCVRWAMLDPTLFTLSHRDIRC